MRIQLLGQGQFSVLAAGNFQTPGDDPAGQRVVFQALRLPPLPRRRPPSVTRAIGTGTDPIAPGLDRRPAPGAAMLQLRPDRMPPDCDAVTCRAAIVRYRAPFARGTRSLQARWVQPDHPAMTQAPTVQPARPI
ncbi:MAG: hypothetical protein P3W94_004835 [Paracoccus sp. (in: a-proteobacteria)]|nr:hypothetical protein [Paracoccus sp. (in: a-proteobacteria)]